MTAGLWIHRCQLPYTSGSRIKMMHRRSDVFHGTWGSALWWFTCNFWQLFWSVLHKNRINTLTELIKKPVKFFWGGVCFSLWWECILRITFSYSKPFPPHRCQQCAQPHDASFPLWKCFVQLSSFIVCQYWGLLLLHYTLGPKEIGLHQQGR